MSYEVLIKRTIYEAKCKCGQEGCLDDVKTENPPKEKLCKCGKWVPYVENSVVGPALGKED